MRRHEYLALYLANFSVHIWTIFINQKRKDTYKRKKNPAFAWSRLELVEQIAHVMYHCPFQPYCLHLTTVRASLVLGCINYVLSSELSKKYLIAFWPNQRKLHQTINSHSRQLGKIERTGIDSKEIFKGLIIKQRDLSIFI